MVMDKTSFYLDPLHSVGYLSRINFRAFSKALENLTEPHDSMSFGAKETSIV
jgi:hypothetical protein